MYLSHGVQMTLLTLTLATWLQPADAGIFSKKEGKTFQTKGIASIMRNSTFTYGAEKKGIPIPEFFDVDSFQELQGLRHDSESGWTKCRVPLKGELSLTGAVDRELVFDCKPLTYR